MFTGIRVHQWDDMSIELDQVDYIEKTDPIQIPRDRRREPESLIDESERKRFRQLIGSLQYAAVHTRADISAKVGEMQSAVNHATVAHLLEANTILQEAKRHKVSLMIVPLQESRVTFCAFSDASFASSNNLTAHQGTIIFATTNELLENNSAVVCPMAWSSKKIPRVVRMLSVILWIVYLGFGCFGPGRRTPGQSGKVPKNCCRKSPQQRQSRTASPFTTTFPGLPPQSVRSIGQQ